MLSGFIVMRFKEITLKLLKKKYRPHNEGMRIRQHGFGAATLKKDNEVIFLEY